MKEPYSSTFVKEILRKLDEGASKYSLYKHYGVREATIKRWEDSPERYTKETKKEKNARIISGAAPLEQPRIEVKSKAVDTPTYPLNGNVVLIIPDIHCPWEHPDALAFLSAVRNKYNPNIIVNLGDEVDFYGMSRYPKDPDVINPGHELSLAIQHLIPFYQAFPKVLVCQSNHTHRLHKKAGEAGLPSESLRSISEILKAPEGWSWKQSHIIDDVTYKHGTGKGGPNAHVNHAKAIDRSCVIGHIHAGAGLQYLRPGKFAVNSACLIDKSAPCFSYAAELDDNIVLGCSVVFYGKVAHFYPMLTDADGRWDGVVYG